MRRRFAKGNRKAGSSSRFGDFSGANTRRANTHLFFHASHDGTHALEVRIPAAPPGIVRVADHVSVMRPFAAEFTLQCHCFSCFFFDCAWVVCYESRKTKLFILADPQPAAKQPYRAMQNVTEGGNVAPFKM
jgi:hypothetical protein